MTVDSLLWLAETMRDLGETALVASSEDVEGSVWVVDDDAPNGIAGYYVKRRIALRHRILRDGRTVGLDFWKNGIQYRIRCGRHGTERKNLDAVCDVLRTLFRWIDDHIVDWDEAFAGFTLDKTDGTEWWRILRVAPDATRTEVDSAYRRLARDVHPDVGGTQEEFLRLRTVYELACVIIAERG